MSQGVASRLVVWYTLEGGETMNDSNSIVDNNSQYGRVLVVLPNLSDLG